MAEMIEMVFAEMLVALGYSAWYEAEEAWDDMAEIMLQMGLDSAEVEEFFEEMAWDL